VSEYRYQRNCGRTNSQTYSQSFALFHPPDALSKLPPEARLGPVDMATLPPPTEKVLTATEAQRLRARKAMPPVHEMVLLQDFEIWAHKVLSEVAWAYYRSAADQERCEEPNTDRSNRFSDQYQ